VNPIEPTDPDPAPGLIPAEDQMRLRWLREDLTSCIAELGAILRRASGEQALVPAFCIAVDTTAPAAEPHPPVTVSWNGMDGVALTYDWRTGALSREPPPG
jgi:hypothetical protein